MCCDMRRDVRMSALTYLQRALLVHDLQALSAVEWEACFNKVMLVSHLTGEFNVPSLNSTEPCLVFCVVTFLSCGKTSILPLNFPQSSIRFASKPKIRLFGSCHFSVVYYYHFVGHCGAFYWLKLRIWRAKTHFRVT